MLPNKSCQKWIKAWCIFDGVHNLITKSYLAADSTCHYMSIFQFDKKNYFRINQKLEPLFWLMTLNSLVNPLVYLGEQCFVICLAELCFLWLWNYFVSWISHFVCYWSLPAAKTSIKFNNLFRDKNAQGIDFIQQNSLMEGWL